MKKISLHNLSYGRKEVKGMKRFFTKGVLFFAVMFVFSLTLASAAMAFPITWQISPDANAIAFGVTVVDGALQINSPNSGTQPVGIFGAGFKATGTSFAMKFDADLYSWDSYNASNGYYDAFVVTVNTQDYYWNLPHTDPITPSASTFVWGGQSWTDDILDHYITAPATTDMISLNSATPTDFYVSLVLDTRTLPQSATLHPSWGSFHVDPVPEPSTFVLMGVGLFGAAFLRRRFRTK